MAKGVEWKNVNTGSFTGNMKKLHTEYVSANETAKAAAIKLRDAIKRDWHTKHPEGKDGKTIAIKVSNGSVQYVMTDAAKAPATKEETGDDIFA